MTDAPDTTIDFASAARYLKIARIAHNTGDEAQFIAARKMVAVALGLPDPTPPRK